LCDLLLALGSLQLKKKDDDQALQTFTAVVEKYALLICPFFSSHSYIILMRNASPPLALSLIKLIFLVAIAGTTSVMNMPKFEWATFTFAGA